VGRTLLSAAFDLPATSGSKKAKSKNNARKNEQQIAKKTKDPKQSSRRHADFIPVPASYAPRPLWRVQVKCSTQLLNGLYRINAHRRTNGRAVPYLPSEIDFFAAYIIPEDTWYIIPLRAIRLRTSLLFRRKRDRKPGLYDSYREAWHLLRP
jgi:hypothetical protein